jgi:capsular polysaccharide biosynthesis protein
LKPAAHGQTYAINTSIKEMETSYGHIQKENLKHMPANISSLKLMTLEALLTPPLVRWKSLSNTSG